MFVIVILRTKSQYAPKSLIAVTWNECWLCKIYPAVKYVSKLKNVIIMMINVSAHISAGHAKVQIAENSHFHEPIIRENTKLSFI